MASILIPTRAPDRAVLERLAILDEAHPRTNVVALPRTAAELHLPAPAPERW